MRDMTRNQRYDCWAFLKCLLRNFIPVGEKLPFHEGCGYVPLGFFSSFGMKIEGGMGFECSYRCVFRMKQRVFRRLTNFWVVTVIIKQKQRKTKQLA